MTVPLLPAHALPFFGPTPVGNWGGVPWDQARITPPAMYLPPAQQPWQNKLALFPSGVVIVTGSVDDDTDGPGGSPALDPCWQPDTSLRWADGSSIDSRQFRGMVMHRVIELRGGRLGDLGAVCWNGIIHFVQYYDEGPTEKLQEGAEKILRDAGVIEAGQSSRHAAVVGNNVQDFCSLIFCGSAPRDAHGRPYALPQEEIIARGWALWNTFTGRPAAAPASGPGKPLVPNKGGAASGSVGLAAPFSIGALTFALSVLMHLRLVAATPPLEIGVWLGCLAFLMSLVNTGLSIRDRLKPNPSLARQFIPRGELELRFKAMDQDIKSLRREGDARHSENVNHLNKLDEKLDRNCKEIGREHEVLRKDVRHDVKEMVQPLQSKLDDLVEGAAEQSQNTAGQLGELKASVRTNDALAAEVRQLMNTVLQRLPRSGGAQG